MTVTMCIFFSNVSDSFNMFVLYFIYLITRQTMVTVGMDPPSVNLLIIHV